jgi:hypothetical protein
MTETLPQKRLIGYARVSTYGQTLDSQLEQLRKAGCSSRNIYREKATGALARPEGAIVIAEECNRQAARRALAWSSSPEKRRRADPPSRHERVGPPQRPSHQGLSQRQRLAVRLPGDCWPEV